MIKYQSAQKLLKDILESKKKYEERKRAKSFEEKIEILVRLQEKAYFFGKTKFKPWNLED